MSANCFSAPCPDLASGVPANVKELLRERRFALLVGARSTSITGNSLGRIALTFGILSIPGATVRSVALILIVQTISQIALVLFGGVLADRFPRARLMVAADLVSALAYTFLTVATALALPVPLLALGAVPAGAATAVFAPAMSGLLPECVPPGALQSANAVMQVTRRGADLLGTALGGVLVALVNAPAVLALNAVSFVASAGLTAAMRLGRDSRARAAGVLADLRDGWRDFTALRWVWSTVAAFSVATAALSLGQSALGPALAQARWDGARSWSLVLAAEAIGMICGGGLSARIRFRYPLRTGVLFSIGLALPMAALGTGAPLWLTVLAALLAGVCTDIFGVLWTTTLQREVPADSLSRISSYDWLGSMALAPLGLALAGPLTSALGTEAATLVCAAAVVLTSAAALLVRDTWRLTGPQPAP
ncbi:MFS transporter [Streptomyces sp. NPDC059786]|uniref:MFS transporter n=1 Tax=Streptomyces sp. NPDC059786 TaxID=3346946 RepID=UPI00366886EA